ncbi:MAG: hypothetical protein KatS3mg105_1678 [Gemmatales bacterium]|nr:MAG: hypothetical protein KatS3mg105_1678 [Gemmatales bacterium]
MSFNATNGAVGNREQGLPSLRELLVEEIDRVMGKVRSASALSVDSVIRCLEGLKERIHKDFAPKTNDALHAGLLYDYTLFKAVIDGISDIVFVKDLEGRYRMLNPAGAHAVGVAPQDVVGKDDYFLFSPEYARQIKERDRAVMQGRETQTYEEPADIDGEVRIFLSTKAPYFDEHGNVIGLIGISRDITDRKRLEQIKSEEQYRAVFQTVTDALFVLTPEGRFVDINPAACRMHQYSKEEFLSLSPLEIIHPDSHEDFKQALTNIFSGASFSCEARHRRKDGTWFDIEVHAVPFTYGGKEHLLAIVHDISERKRTEKTLRELSKRLVRIQEQERKSLAHELHDEIGQHLSLLHINLRTLLESSEDPALTGRLHNCLLLTETTLERGAQHIA